MLDCGRESPESSHNSVSRLLSDLETISLTLFLPGSLPCYLPPSSAIEHPFRAISTSICAHLAIASSAYAVWRAGTAVIETANTDWRAKYELEKRTRQQRRQSAADRRTLDENQVGLLEDDDDDEEVIEFEDVLHVIIIPK